MFLPYWDELFCIVLVKTYIFIAVQMRGGLHDKTDIQWSVNGLVSKSVQSADLFTS